MKTFLVTGATSGIGLSTAQVLAQQPVNLLIVGRDAQKTQQTVTALQQQSGNQQIEGLLADFSNLQAIRQLALEVQTRCTRLDLLINNAGAVFAGHQLTQDGYERTWAVNHLASFLLTRLLEKQLQASTAARIVNVASSEHRNGRIAWKDPNLSQHYTTYKAYCQSKLANVMFTYALAHRLEGSRVTANCLHPGTVATQIWRGGPSWTHPFMGLASLMMRKPDQGAKTTLHLALSDQVFGVNGKYFVACEARRSSPASNDIAAQERLWELSCQQTGLKP